MINFNFQPYNFQAISKELTMFKACIYQYTLLGKLPLFTAIYRKAGLSLKTTNTGMSTCYNFLSRKALTTHEIKALFTLVCNIKFKKLNSLTQLKKKTKSNRSRSSSDPFKKLYIKF